jgi:tRNA pseudouridine38-40 synthase
VKTPPPAARKRPAPANAPSAFRLRVEYDGGRFQGWQRQGTGQTQAGVRTVAGILEKVLRDGGLRVRTLVGAGRTDAGVHALGQVAHLHLEEKGIRPGDLQLLLDKGLPGDLAVQSVEPCSPSFHARHDAVGRSYLFQLSLRRSALAKPFLWWVKGEMNHGHLIRAWEAFEGLHNFSAFADLQEGDDPRCGIEACEWAENGSLLLLRVTASHFKYRQVRRMVGAAVQCAQGKARPEEILRDLERPTPEARDRWAATAAPASGLFLERVRYPGDPEHLPLRPVTWVP